MNWVKSSSFNTVTNEPCVITRCSMQVFGASSRTVSDMELDVDGHYGSFNLNYHGRLLEQDWHVVTLYDRYQPGN